IVDNGNKRVRKVDSGGIVTTVAGDGNFGSTRDGGAATSAAFNSPIDVFVDSSRTVFISDWPAGRLRKGSARRTNTPPASGIITTFAGGSSTPGNLGDGGPATSAFIGSPQGIALDPSGNVYVLDAGLSRVRKISPNGTITTFAGNGTGGFSGDGGP